MANRSEAVILEAEDRYRAGDYGASVLALAPLVESPRPDARALCITGLCRLRQGDAGEALRLLHHAHRLAPLDASIRLHLGIGLQANGRHREAMPHFKECQRALPSDPAPFLNLASSALVLGEPGEARRAARRARVRAPQLPQAHYVLGQIELARAQDVAAEMAFVRATQLAPNFIDAWVNLGVARYRNGALEGAKV